MPHFSPFLRTFFKPLITFSLDGVFTKASFQGSTWIHISSWRVLLFSHSVEITHFFCCSDFTWNQFWQSIYQKWYVWLSWFLDVKSEWEKNYFPYCVSHWHLQSKVPKYFTEVSVFNLLHSVENLGFCDHKKYFVKLVL